MRTQPQPAATARPDIWAGCGWYQSSRDLAEGAEATEVLRPDALAAELPLEWWLDWQLRGMGSAAMA